MGLSATARRADTTVTVVNESMAAAPTTGTLQGVAAWNAGGFLRLNSTASTVGRIEYQNNLSSNFSAQADFAMSSTTGADAIWFYFGCSTSPATESSTTNIGYVIERNDIGTTNSNIRIRYAGTQLATVSYVKDSAFDTLRIDYIRQKFTITYKGSVVLTYTDPTARTLPGRLCGWGARSGTTFNTHDIKNLSLIVRHGV